MKNLKFSNYFFFLCFIALTSCKKDGASPKDGDLITKTSQLDAFLTKVMNDYNTVSLSATITKEDKLIWSKGYGFANKEANKIASNESIYMVASISKTVTGVAVMQLVEQGKINLDADINTYLPFEVKNPKNSASVITCRHLLTHTSGIVDNHLGEVYEQLLYMDEDPTLSLAEVCEGFFTTNGDFYSPDTFTDKLSGAEFNYSNIGIALLGYVVEVVAQKPFYQFTKENIFEPLGMTRTSWRLADLPSADLAMPYDENNQPYGHYTLADYPNGGLFTTVDDLSKYLRAFVNGGILNGTRILNQASVTEMQKIQSPTIAPLQGLAWNADNYDLNRNLRGHLGAERGVATLMYFDTDSKVGAIVFMNKLPESEEIGFEIVQKLLANLLNVGEKN
ncbi:MAG: serine hydrolase domain-containing protein [Microscillaceae bacterium]|nr:serine hydrolase domain-containing protein [Microscillaceae bacterium]